MLLTLSIKNHQGKTTPTREEYNFGQAGGSIGRAPNNDWALPDKNNYLSKKHAIIEFTEGHFYIIDKSVNGVFINYSTTPLGRENRHQIFASDEILMGEYTLIVKQLDESQPLADTESTPNSTESPPQPRFPFTRPTSTNDDPFAEIFDAKKNDQQENEPSNQNTSIPLDEKEQAEIDNKEQALETETNDSALLDEDKIANTKQKESNEKHHDDENNATAIILEKPEENKQPLTPQHSNQHNNDVSSNTKSNQQLDENKNNIDIVPEKSTEKEEKLPKITTKKTHKAQEKEKKPTINKKPAEHTGKKKTIRQDTGDSQVNKKKQIPPPSDTNDPLTHILQSAGLNTEDISKIDSTPETYQLIGQILKESLDGTMNLLRTRHAAKNHLNLDNTLISRRKNNPLKFLPNAQFVLRQTLPSRTDYIDDTFQPLNDALMEAYDDISAHEYAMATSIQEALAITIKKHFAPTSLEKKLEKNSPIISKIPLKREADLWQLFTSIYDEIAEEASESFQVLLDKEIVNAYEIQIKHLKAQR